MIRRYWFPKPYADRVQRLRVPFGFLLVGAFAWLSQPTLGSLAAGIPIALAGLALRAWAAGHLAKNRELATSGPYGHTRNPLYVGTLTVAAGLVLAARRPALAVLFAAAFALVYLPAIELEEQHLRKLFPAYAEYARNVPLLWPRPRRWGAARRFRFELYLRNQEYQALAGLLAGLALLTWKAA
ncbi:MAG: isoprenylcysteine carboxylmethyltransferase family protein [Acidobacteria bacterium]|nr:isoprenylcysteine carboxylmethyltransferase family protein [Acidobacteriota bacterium]